MFQLTCAAAEEERIHVINGFEGIKLNVYLPTKLNYFRHDFQNLQFDIRRAWIY